MKKRYLDVTDEKGCVAVFQKNVEIIRAGTTIYSMPEKERNEAYRRYADEYDIHFIFDSEIPKIDFYAVPQVDIMAVDRDGGYIGTIGQVSDLESNAPVCYIDKNRNCYLIAECGREFLECASVWKEHLIPYKDIAFYHSKTDAEAELDFVDWHPTEVD